MSMEGFKGLDGNAARKLPPRPHPKLERVQPPTEIEEISEVLTEADFVDESVEENIEEADIIESREPGELQTQDVVHPFEVKGFLGIEVAATLEKKNIRKGKTKRNEDNIITDAETGVFGVLDGLGGEGAEGSGAKASTAAEAAIPAAYTQALAEAKKLSIGDVAQKIVEQQLARLNIADPATKLTKKKELSEMFEGVTAKDPEMGRKATALVESIRRANQSVLETGDEKTRGKTTACIGLIHKGPDGKSYGIIASIGDSVAFKRRGNTGEMVPLTMEDSLLNLMTSAGSINPKQFEQMKQEPTKDFKFPISLELIQALGGDQTTFENFQKNGPTELPLNYKKLKRAMSRSMGAETAEPALTIREMKQGDELILATDVFDNFEDPKTGEMDFTRMARVAGNTGSQTERLGRLREAAKQGPKDDDAALVSARVL